MQFETDFCKSHPERTRGLKKFKSKTKHALLVVKKLSVFREFARNRWPMWGSNNAVYWIRASESDDRGQKTDDR